MQASAEVGLRLEPASGAYSAEAPTGAIGDLGTCHPSANIQPDPGGHSSLVGGDYVVAS